jgi:protein-S-isoprenylcysteine O-methyltransferase Ste14
MFVLVRAVAWATLFIGFVLVALPARVLSAAGVQPPAVNGPLQIAGSAIALCGAALAVACIATFVVLGKGTPAPFDPPRRLVVRGPYRWVRNPMYLGGAIAMTGAALFYESWALFAYVLGFLAVTHVFVVAYEEPTLRRLFDGDYDAYCARVRRWTLGVRCLFFIGAKIKI